MVPTREQVMAAYRKFWDKNLSCRCVAPHMMHAIIAAELAPNGAAELASDEGFLPTDANLNIIREHLADEVSQENIVMVKRGRAAGYYRSKGHMPVVGSSNQITTATGKDLERLATTFGLAKTPPPVPTPTQAPVAKQDPNSYSYLFLDEEGNQ